MQAIDCIKKLAYALDERDLSDSEMQGLIDAWVKFSPDEVSAAREHLNRVFFGRNRSYFMFGAMLAGLGVWGYLIFILTPPASSPMAFALGVMVYASMAALYTLALSLEDGLIKPVLAREGLRLASELPSGDCSQALSHVRAFPELQAYRDTLVNNGRELTALDLSYISHRAWRLSYAKRQAELAWNSKKICRELHGLPE